MKVEVAHKDSGNSRVEVQAREGREGRGVVDIIVEGDNPQNSRAVMDVSDKQAWVAAKVVTDNTAPRDKLPLASTRVSPGVHHHLGTLVRSEVGVVEVPVGMGSPTEDVKAVAFSIVTGYADARKPGLRHTQNIVIDVGGEKRMHGKIPPPHIDRKDGPYHH